MKSAFNPLIEALATRLFGVDQYADIFEKMALSSRHHAIMRALGRRRLAPDIGAASILFVHVPKNGGTSVKRALYASDPGHASIRYYDLFFPDFLTQAETVAILRDPVDRFLSGFDFLRNGGGGAVDIQGRPLRRMQGITTLDALLDHITARTARGDWLAVDTFLRPQCWYLTDAKDILRIRQLWTLELLDGRFAAYLHDHGARDIGHVNQTRRERRILTHDQYQRLHSLYADDFALYTHVLATGGHETQLYGVPIGKALAPFPHDRAGQAATAH